MSDKTNSGTETNATNYIKSNYVIPTCIIGSVFILGLAIIGGVAFKVNTWSYGIIALLFMALVLGLATLIALIATFREIGRKQAREFSDEMKRIKDKLDDLEDDKKLQERLTKLGYKN